jgi:hypothetical protein
MPCRITPPAWTGGKDVLESGEFIGGVATFVTDRGACSFVGATWMSSCTFGRCTPLTTPVVAVGLVTAKRPLVVPLEVGVEVEVAAVEAEAEAELAFVEEEDDPLLLPEAFGVPRIWLMR